MTGVERLIVAAIVAILLAIGWSSYRDAVRWQEFRESHNCKAIEHVASSTATGIGANGQTSVVVIPGKTAYRCDDGVIYWREQ